MATIGKPQAKISVQANMCRVDHAKASGTITLPSDILSDLQDAFALYDRDN